MKIKKYKVKMSESRLEEFKKYLAEQKKSTKKIIKEEEDILGSDEGEDEVEDDFEDDDDDDDYSLSVDDMFDKLVDDGIATEEEVRLVTSINGYNEESMLDILYARTGFRNFSQYDED